MSGLYVEALEWIRKNHGTSGATGLEKMILSLYDSECSFAFSECTADLDPNQTALCLKMCADYVQNGKTEELSKVGKEIAEFISSRLWDQGQAMSKARSSLKQQWLEEEREENRAEKEALRQHDRLRGTYHG